MRPQPVRDIAEATRVHRCKLCNATVSAQHFCHGCKEYVCDNCAGQANEKPLAESHALIAHVERTLR